MAYSQAGKYRAFLDAQDDQSWGAPGPVPAAGPPIGSTFPSRTHDVLAALGIQQPGLPAASGVQWADAASSGAQTLRMQRPTGCWRQDSTWQRPAGIAPNMQANHGWQACTKPKEPQQLQSLCDDPDQNASLADWLPDTTQMGLGRQQPQSFGSALHPSPHLMPHSRPEASELTHGGSMKAQKPQAARPCREAPKQPSSRKRAKCGGNVAAMTFSRTTPEQRETLTKLKQVRTLRPCFTHAYARPCAIAR